MFVEAARSNRPLQAVHSNLRMVGVKSVYKLESGHEHLFVRPTTDKGIQTIKEIAEHVLLDLCMAQCKFSPADVLGWYKLEAK